MTHDIIDLTRETTRLLNADESFATVTLIAVRGSAPQVIGAKALITDQGIVAGTIGGGKVEAAAIEHAQEMLNSDGQPNDLVTWNLQTDIGMTCGGEVQLFFECFRPTVWPIAIFGAGHVAQALIPILLKLNCKVTCIDARPDWISKLDAHPKLRTIVAAGEPEEHVDSFPDHTFFVLMSKGHATDLPVLAKLLTTRSAPYIGVIGSKQKASVLKRDLSKQGIGNELCETFHCPIGLPLGDNTPAEIAISIAAQLIQVRDQIAAK